MSDEPELPENVEAVLNEFDSPVELVRWMEENIDLEKLEKEYESPERVDDGDER